MPRVAFYAPMKPPTHPVPSGDREMARNLMKAIGQGGARVDLASELRVHDKTGDPAYQAQARRHAEAETDRLTRRLGDNGTALWVTYHNYYKAPDLLGPAVCRALNLPYVQIEATRARKRLSGPWSDFAAAAETASDAAAAIFFPTAHDRITLRRHRPDGQALVRLAPFLPATELPAPSACEGPMLAVGMMRRGDKLASYRIMAETLAHLGDTGWRLDIAGDGPARPEVQALMAPFGDRVRFLGQLDRRALQLAYRGSSVLLWPGVNEAYGMVYLEAQSHGLPVVAQNRPGVRDVLVAGDYPGPGDGPEALAAMLRRLLMDAGLRRETGRRARRKIARSHLMQRAGNTFWSAAAPLLEGAA